MAVPMRLKRAAVSVIRPLRTFNQQAGVRVGVRQNRDGGFGDRRHAGDAGQPVLQLLEEFARLLWLVAVQERRHAEHDDVIGVQPEVDPSDVQQALGKEAGGHEERHRQRDLERGERG